MRTVPLFDGCVAAWCRSDMWLHSRTTFATEVLFPQGHREVEPILAAAPAQIAQAYAPLALARQTSTPSGFANLANAMKANQGER